MQSSAWIITADTEWLSEEIRGDLPLTICTIDCGGLQSLSECAASAAHSLAIRGNARSFDEIAELLSTPQDEPRYVAFKLTNFMESNNKALAKTLLSELTSMALIFARSRIFAKIFLC